MPADPQVTELDGTLNTVLRYIKDAQILLDNGNPHMVMFAGDLLGDAINLLEAQRAAAPDRPLSWD